MKTLNLPLFSIENPSLTVDIPHKEVHHFQVTSINPIESLETILQEILPQTTEDNIVIKTRRILGEKAKNLSDEQIHCNVTEFQFLINTWLDEFEKDVFHGMTLKEVLNGQ